jgi:hypothetical protein
MESQVVILVHGIRDYALWQNSIRATLERAGFKAEPTNYDRFNLLKFLLPIWFFRRQAIEEVWKQIRIIAQNNPNTPISVIAHSFGTFVVSHLLKEGFDLKFHRIIFCGSVVPYNFDYEQIQNRFVAPILNEVGTRDIWPAVAESLTSGYGSAGTHGFRRPLVRDRWHNGAGHGYFLDARFCKKYWIPFLSNGEIVKGPDSPEDPPVWLRTLSIFKIKYALIVLAIVMAIVGIADVGERFDLGNRTFGGQHASTRGADSPAIVGGGNVTVGPASPPATSTGSPSQTGGVLNGTAKTEGNRSPAIVSGGNVVVSPQGDSQRSNTKE